MPSQKQPVILIGCGMIGHHHARAISRHPIFYLAAVCDPHPEARAHAKEEGDASDALEFDNWESALAATTGREVVVVALPPYLHAGAVIAAVERGLPTLCEKPLAASVDDAQTMVDVAGANRVLLVDGSSRYLLAPIVQILRDYIQGGTLGLVFRLTFVARKPRARPGIDDDLMDPRWRWSRTLSGGGPLSGHGVYDLAMLARILPPPTGIVVSGAVAVQLETDWRPPDGSACDVESTGGATLTFRYSDRPPIVVEWQRNGAVNDKAQSFLRVEGTRGTLLWDWGNQADMLAHYYDERNRVASRAIPVPTSSIDPHEVPLRLLAEDLANGANETDNSRSVTGREALGHLKVIHAVYRLAGTGGSELVSL